MFGGGLNNTPARMVRRMLLPQLPEGMADDLPPIVKIRGPELCLKCRFARLLCGRPACPILMKASAYAGAHAPVSREMQGDSPPSAFVGRFGYPKVTFGPLVPPASGDTLRYDEPELWAGLGFSDIVRYRMSLVRATRSVAVSDALDPKGLLYDLQTSFLSVSPVRSELSFSRPPRGGPFIDDSSPPFGPSAALERYRLGAGRSDRRLERVYYDRDMKATEGMARLYSEGLTVNSIQRVLSLGMMGTKRKLVPTRWSITAVDDTLSRALLERVKAMPSIDLHHVFVHDYLGSRYVLLFAPGAFSYEWIEAWFPRTLFNQASSSVHSIGDHEGFRGRKTYAAPGGCYYSVRLAVAEYLERLRRQATVIALREIYPGQLLPLGVWNVREAIRAALRSEPVLFDDMGEAVSYALSKMAAGETFWRSSSYLLKQAMTQRKLASFM